LYQASPPDQTQDTQRRPTDPQGWPLVPRSTFAQHQAVISSFLVLASPIHFTCPSEASSSLPLPAVLTAPIRLDVVQQVHSAYKPCPHPIVVCSRASQGASTRTSVKLTLSAKKRATRPRPSHGVPVAPSLVFPASVVEALTARAKPLSVTCAAVVGCSRPRRPGVDGTSR
jgi:hypothetical protein